MNKSAESSPGKPKFKPSGLVGDLVTLPTHLRAAIVAALCELVLTWRGDTLFILLRCWRATPLNLWMYWLRDLLAAGGIVVVLSFGREAWRIHSERTQIGFYSQPGLGSSFRGAAGMVMGTLVLAAVTLLGFLISPLQFMLLSTVSVIAMLVRFWECSLKKTQEMLLVIQTHRLDRKEARIYLWYATAWTQSAWLLLSLIFMIGVPINMMHREGLSVHEAFLVGAGILGVSAIVLVLPVTFFAVLPIRDVLRKIKDRGE